MNNNKSNNSFDTVPTATETRRNSSVYNGATGEVQDIQTAVQPPFLVRTKTREEKEDMREQMKRQESRRDNGTYSWLQKYYTKFSTSFMLENKAATARDHLGNFVYISVDNIL